MATNPTTYRAYGKPTDQGSSQTWGVELIAFMDALDADIHKLLTTANYADADGTADILTATPDPAFAAYATGMALWVLIAADNTTGPTINVNGLGAKDIKAADGSTLAAGALKAGAIAPLVYDGTRFLLIDTPRASAAEVLTGTDAFKVATPAALAGNKSLAANGYYKFPGGLIVQWGTYTAAISDETVNITIAFPIAFPAATVGIWATPRNTANSTGGNTVMQEVSLTVSGAVLKPNGAAGTFTDVSGGFRWVALGY